LPEPGRETAATPKESAAPRAETAASTLPVWSIRRLLIIGILALEIATVGALVLSNYLSARSALSNNYEAMAHQVAGSAVARAQDLLTNAAAAVVDTRDAIEDGVLLVTDQPHLAQFLFESVKADHQLAGLYFGSPAGDFVYVTREHPGEDDLFRVKTIRIEGDQRAETVQLRDRHWQLMDEATAGTDNFLPTTRPWYHKALQIGGDGWTAPYTFYTSARPGISFARTVTTADGRIVGVVGGDIELGDIARFIAALRVGTHGRAMIVTRGTGKLAAADDPLSATPFDGSAAQLTPLSPTDNSGLMAALDRFNAVARGEGELPAADRYAALGTRYVSVTVPFAAADLPWILVIAVPETDYLGWFYDAQRTTLVVSVLIGLGAILLSMILWRALADPLERLRRNARAVGTGRWDDLRPIASRLAEIRETEAAIQSMAGLLSEGQRTNDRLVQHLRKLAAAVEQSPAALLITDGVGQIEYVNPAFERLTRYPLAAMLGQPISALGRHPEDCDTYQQITRALAEGVVWRGEHSVEVADTGSFDAAFVVAPVRNDAGAVSNAIVIIEDVTEARAHERAITKALDAAVAANQARAEFLAHMSHDLRTPLNAILGFSEIMRAEMFGPIGDRRYLEYSKDIWDSGSYLLRIVNDVLEIARAESASLAVDEDDVLLPALIETVCRLTAGQAISRRIRMTVEVAGDLHLRVDATKLQQILVNLVSNAIKFTPEGGRIHISTRKPAGGGVELRVADTGNGMTRQQIDLALQPFTRIENNPLTRKTEGIGLGLPIAQRLIHLHGGTLTFDSAPGIGTTVIIWLPPERVIENATAAAP
jgi:PAS domain S-box-containing protein